MRVSAFNSSYYSNAKAIHTDRQGVGVVMGDRDIVEILNPGHRPGLPLLNVGVCWFDLDTVQYISGVEYYQAQGRQVKIVPSDVGQTMIEFISPSASKDVAVETLRVIGQLEAGS